MSEAAVKLDESIESQDAAETLPPEPTMATAAERALAMARQAGLAPSAKFLYEELLGLANARQKQALLERHRAPIEALATAGIPVNLQVFELETVATGLPPLAARARRIEGVPDASLQPALRRLFVLRDVVVPTLQGAAAAGQVPAGEVARIVAGRGYLNYAMDVAEGIDLADRTPAVFANHPTLTPALKAEGRRLSLEVLNALQPEGRPTEPKELDAAVKAAREERGLAYALLLQLDAEANRLLTFVLGEAEAKKQVPALQAGRNGRAQKAAPSVPPPA